MAQEDLSLLGIFVLVLIVFGFSFILEYPHALETDRSVIPDLPAVKEAAAAQAQSEAIAYAQAHPLVGLAPLALCLSHKNAAQKAYAEAESFRQEAKESTYAYLRYTDAVKRYTKGMDIYILCIKKQ